MHGLTLVDLAPIPPQPWRNRAGIAREMLAWPSSSDWQVRISVADIGADGPFSSLPGIDRWFAVVEGDGVVLRWENARRVLGIDTGPCHFDGGAPPACSLQGGATRDLNLMARRDTGRATMRRVEEGAEWISSAPLRALFTIEALTLQIDDADAVRMPPWHLAYSTHASRQRWRVVSDNGTCRAWWMDYLQNP